MTRLKQLYLIGTGLVSAALLGAHFLPLPPVQALNTGVAPELVGLRFSWLYNLFTPFLSIAERLTILSAQQQMILWGWLVVFWVLVRLYVGCRSRSVLKLFGKEAGYFLSAIFVLAAFYAFTILCPHPVGRLVVQDPDWMVIDYHSHTSFSWDGNKRFTPEKNLAWHKRQGYDACFITDHNLVEGAAQVYSAAMAGKDFGIAPLRGEEVSLHQSHWVLLGNAQVLPNTLYDGSMEGIERFLKKEQQDPTTIVIASLPEYWKYHWQNKETFIDWGVNGFEIVNSFPWALDFPRSMQKEIIELCQKNNLIVTGISDNHGWGPGTYAWNTLYLPGWRLLAKEKIESAVIQSLAQNKFSANQVWVRTKHEPAENKIVFLFDPFLQFINLARTLEWVQTASFLVWVWLPIIFGWRFKNEQNVDRN